jgi:hypothetical protein
MNPVGRNRQLIHGIVVVVGSLLILGLAYAVDSWREYTRVYYSETFSHLLEISFSYVLGNLLLSAAVVSWSWFVLTKGNLRKWLYLILIIPGLIITLYPIIYFSPVGSILYVAYRLSPAFQIYLTGGIIATVGIVKVIFQGKIHQGG